MLNRDQESNHEVTAVLGGSFVIGNTFTPLHKRHKMVITTKQYEIRRWRALNTIRKPLAGHRRVMSPASKTTCRPLCADSTSLFQCAVCYSYYLVQTTDVLVKSLFISPKSCKDDQGFSVPRNLIDSLGSFPNDACVIRIIIWHNAF